MQWEGTQNTHGVRAHPSEGFPLTGLFHPRARWGLGLVAGKIRVVAMSRNPPPHSMHPTPHAFPPAVVIKGARVSYFHLAGRPFLQQVDYVLNTWTFPQ